MELKKKLIAYDRTLLIADPRRMEPKKFGGGGARARRQKRFVVRRGPSRLSILTRHVIQLSLSGLLYLLPVLSCLLHISRECHGGMRP
jgi:hypothetical protein